MINPLKSKAEAKFDHAQKKLKQALKEKEQARKERAEKVSRLRALRLSREAAEGTNLNEGGTETADSADDTPEPMLPQPYRQGH